MSKINISIGENNSGKSRLLRSLLSNELDYIPDSSFIENYNSAVEGLKNEFTSYLRNIDKDYENFQAFKIVKEMNNIEYLNQSSNFKDIKELADVIKSMQNERRASIKSSSQSAIAQHLSKIFQEKTSVFGEDLEKYLRLPEFKKLYIPILRDLKPLNFENEEFKYVDIYCQRVIKDYFNNPDVHTKIDFFTGIHSNIVIKDHLLGILRQRKLINDYKVYLSKNFFNSKDVTLIPSQSNGVVTVKIGDEKERPIYELGDGIQSIIILTLPLFINRVENLLVFIEEPEKLLHPGLQRKLIETFLHQEGFENYQYFVTTHSNHFLDITLDFSGISIYTLRKKLNKEFIMKKKLVP